MRAIQFDGANHHNEAERQGELDMPSYTDGLTHVTCWQFNREDLQKLMENGGCFYMVGVFGFKHPAVGMTVENPVPKIQLGLPYPIIKK